MVGDIQLIAIDVAIGDSNDAGIALNVEGQLILTGQHPTAFTIHGGQTDVLQVHTVSFPVVVVWLGNNLDGLTCGLQSVMGDSLALLIGNGF